MAGNARAVSAPVVGRFAPSPTGRMHLGNVYTALISWLAARSAGGRWILRIEDLDPQRSRTEYARQIEDDLNWLGLDWDEGGLDDRGPHGPYSQSRRSHLYENALARLRATGLTYPCRCTRADLNASSAPHASDGRRIYPGTCRPAAVPPFPAVGPEAARPAATRLYVPDTPVAFTDAVFGPQTVDVARECGDFVLRRADGAWAYQLAVVVDDADMEVSQIVRGADLLASAAQQDYLRRILGLPPVQYAHLPLVCNAGGRRLSKRDPDLDMAHLRRDRTPQQIIGLAARLAGLNPAGLSVRPADLLADFSFSRIQATPTVTLG